MLREIERIPGAGRLEGRIPGVPTISASFLADLLQDPIHTERMGRVRARADQRQALREAAENAADLAGRAATLAANVCTIAIHGDGMAVTREVVRQFSPIELD